MKKITLWINKKQYEDKWILVLENGESSFNWAVDGDEEEKENLLKRIRIEMGYGKKEKK